MGTLSTSRSSSGSGPQPLFSFKERAFLLAEPVVFGHSRSASVVKRQSDQVYRCKRCHSHICTKSLVVAGDFTGNYGPAMFVTGVLNTELGEDTERKRMVTGRYEIKSLLCHQCHEDLGWKYLYSESDRQKYKEGKYVVELEHLESVES